MNNFVIKKNLLFSLLICFYFVLTNHSAIAQETFKLERVESPSSRFKEISNDDYKLSLPDSWSAHPFSYGVMFGPKGSYFSGINICNSEYDNYCYSHGVDFGIIPLRNNLEETTKQILNESLAANPHLQRRDIYQTASISGREALVTTTSGSNYKLTGLAEIYILYTVLHPTGRVFYIWTAVPQVNYSQYQPIFEKIISSIQFGTKSKVSGTRIDDDNYNNNNSWQVTLDARENWFDTDIPVSNGTSINISANGEIIWNLGERYPTATPSGVSYSPTDLGNSSGFPSTSAKCGSLVMKIGNTIYAVGAGITLTLQNIEENQTIKFMVNDRYTGLSDNSGTFNIRIHTSQPKNVSANEMQSVTMTGFVDVLEEIKAGCRIKIIAGEKIFSGEITYIRLTELTGQKISSYEDAVNILSGRRITVTLTNNGNASGGSAVINFGGISRITFPTDGDIKQSSQKLNERTTDKEIIVDLSTDILFDFDSSTLKPEAVSALIKLARLIRQSKTGIVQLNGFTDSIGSSEYNLGLSARRATSVKQWLVTKGGIDSKRLRIKGYGENQPVAPNTNQDGSDNPVGRQKNRRVEVRIPRN